MSKNVALSNDAYTLLERLKIKDESFSDVVIRLGNGDKKPNWRDSIGALKGDKEAGKIFDRILKERHKIIKRREIKW